MISFASLFLGLTVGSQPIELVVQGDVAAVVLELDGREVATLRGEPWEREVDLGADLHPHLLEALAFGSDGALVGRARQWVNLPREPVEASLVLEGLDPARPDRARLVWQHLVYSRAETITATLDGAPVAVDPRGQIALPAYDPAQLHVLSAELRFEDGARHRSQVGFGGAAGSVVDTELTGVVVRTTGSPPTVETLAGAILRDGEVLQPVAVEKAPASVVMVVDQDAIPVLRSFRTFGLETGSTRIKTGEELRFVFPAAETLARRDVPTRLFDVSPPFTHLDGGFAYLLSHVVPPPAHGRPQRLTDAVAIASLQAAAGARPRTVVLVLGAHPRDESVYRIGEVRRFLEELHVPLLVWSTSRPGANIFSKDRQPVTTSTPWGSADDVGTARQLLGAVDCLRAILDDQYTVWVEGSHLPSRLKLAPGVTGVHLAGVAADRPDPGQ